MDKSTCSCKSRICPFKNGTSIADYINKIELNLESHEKDYITEEVSKYDDTEIIYDTVKYPIFSREGYNNKCNLIYWLRYLKHTTKKLEGYNKDFYHHTESLLNKNNEIHSHNNKLKGLYRKLINENNKDKKEVEFFKDKLKKKNKKFKSLRNKFKLLFNSHKKLLLDNEDSEDKKNDSSECSSDENIDYVINSEIKSDVDHIFIYQQLVNHMNNTNCSLGKILRDHKQKNLLYSKFISLKIRRNELAHPETDIISNKKFIEILESLD